MAAGHVYCAGAGDDRLSNKRFAQLLVAAYVSYHRNVPTLIQLMMWYFAIPTLLPESLQMWVNEDECGVFLFSLVALGLCRAAYFSEDIPRRPACHPAGQNEGGEGAGNGVFARHAAGDSAAKGSVTRRR